MPIGYSQYFFSKTAKVAIRYTGNRLLLFNNDSTSLVLPVIKLDKNKYELSFEKKLEIVPDSLVNTFNKSFKLANLPKDYIVEVINCNTKEVVYSYQFKGSIEENIIPCLGRILSLDCYKIQVVFTEQKHFSTLAILYIMGSILLLGLVFFLLREKKPKVGNSFVENDYIIFGTYKFYEDQHKIINKGVEFKLTLKESQILKIFIENQNVIIKRERFIKEVWEDNGIIVGRSLDAFISKIRKRFENDASINIVNIHGVGYKFEVI